MNRITVLDSLPKIDDPLDLMDEDYLWVPRVMQIRYRKDKNNFRIEEDCDNCFFVELDEVNFQEFINACQRYLDEHTVTISQAEILKRPGWNISMIDAYLGCPYQYDTQGNTPHNLRSNAIFRLRDVVATESLTSFKIITQNFSHNKK